MKNPRIISVISFPFLPATTGGTICTAGLLKELAEVTEVTAFTVEPYQPGYETQTGKTEMHYVMPFKASRYINLLLFFKLKKLAAQKHAQWLLFEQPWFAWLIFLCKWLTPYKIVIRSHNIEYLRFRSLRKWYWQILYMYEKWAYKNADVMIFLTEEDRQIAIHEFDLKPEKTAVIPYGVSLDAIPESTASGAIKHRIGLAKNDCMILYYATMSYKPNYDGVVDVVNHVLPLLREKSIKFKLVVCGKNLPSEIKDVLLTLDDVIYEGFVDDLHAYIDEADVILNPILSGGGIKTKAIDGLARNKIVVSTVTGAAGIIPEVCGKNLLVSPDGNWTDFAQNIIAANNITANIPGQFYEVYGWKSIVSRFMKLLA